MGKAADNERVKLNATWNNNVSVGLALAGVIVPYLAFVQNWTPLHGLHGFPAMYDWLGDQQNHFKALAFVIAFVGSRFFRNMALKEIAKIQD
jgi:hypothetical protein